MTDKTARAPWISTEWRAAKGPVHFDLYAADNVDESLRSPFAEPLLHTTDEGQLREALELVAQQNNVAIIWIDGGHSDPLHQRITVTVIPLRHTD